MTPLKMALAGFATIDLATFHLPDVNVVLNALALVAILYFGPKYARVANLRSQLGEKNKAIETNDQSIESLEKRCAGMQEELRGLEVRADALEVSANRATHEAAEWKARYDEQSRYTAKPAIEALQVELHAHIEAVAQRHEKMIHALDLLTERVASTEADSTRA